MKRMAMILVAILVFTASESIASAASHRVKVMGKDDARAVAKALMTKLNATERYEAVGDVPENASLKERFGYDLLLSIVCFDDATHIVGAHVKGATCMYTSYYVPWQAPLLFLPIGDPGLSSGSDSEQIAATIFQTFVNETTETEIQKADKLLKESVAMFCSWAGDTALVPSVAESMKAVCSGKESQ